MSTFAPVVTSAQRVELEQIFDTDSGNANFNQATDNDTFLISAVLQILKNAFTFQCVSPPEAPNAATLCTNWKIVLA